MLRLSVEQGPDAGRIFLTKNNHAVVGQHGEIALSDRNVSPYHALLQLQPNDTTVITDLNSGSGTWFGYGERPAEQLVLKSGMCFKVGNSVLRLEVDHVVNLELPAQVSAQPYTPPVLQETVPVVQPCVAPPVAVIKKELSNSLAPIRAIPLPVVTRRSNLLELEFDPDILAVADESDGAALLQLDEPEEVIIPDFTLSPAAGQAQQDKPEAVTVPELIHAPVPVPEVKLHQPRGQTALDGGTTSLVMPFEFRMLVSGYGQREPLRVNPNLLGWKIALASILLTVLILALILITQLG
ncbi:MAG: FHA domain-containing protein [Chloroflexota bacterium]